MTNQQSMDLADAIRSSLSSPNVSDSNGEQANIVDTMNNLAKAMWASAHAITPPGAQYNPGHDASGGTVGSLTEAVMGITAGLVEIAGAIRELAEAHAEKT